MKRFISLFLAFVMVCSFMNISILAGNPASSPSPIISDGIANDMQEETKETYDGIADDMQEETKETSDGIADGMQEETNETSNGIANDIEDEKSQNDNAYDLSDSNFPNGIADDLENSASNTCSHGRIKESFFDDKCKKYDKTRHELIGEYIIKCLECGETLERINGKKKELHNFKNGKCKDCGYEVKDCEHKETEDIVTYWYNGANERGNDASYVEYDIVCTYCKVKVDSKVHYGPVTAIKSSLGCKHGDVEEIAVATYYEPSTEETHYKLTKYIVKCLECKEEFNNYIEEREYKHEIENGNCTKCIYEVKKASTGSSEKTSNYKNAISEVTYENQDISSSENTNNINTETIESIFISTEQRNYAANGKQVAWKSMPKEINGTLQVPLRELAEKIGFKVTWDGEKNIAYVDCGNSVKTFISDFDVYMIDSGEKRIGVNLTNKSKIVDGIFYVDIDGLLDGTEYAYYKNDTMYHITYREEVINRVARDQLTGNNLLTTSESLYNDKDYLSALEENDIIYAFEQDEESYYYAVIKPMADQAVYGNYYEGDATIEGVVCRIIVGELPGVGTAADIRDVVADFQNWETTWSHVGNTLLDIVGLVPIVGSLKYADELALAAKNADDVSDVARKINKVTDVSKNANNLGPVTQVDELVESAKKTGDVIDNSKDANRVLKLSKESIKNVDDLKKLTKHPEIYSDSALNHIFYGNSKGGLHYNGLSGANGKIDKITKAPNEFGVYEADVTILGKKKTNHSFFPDSWSPDEVIDAIEEAYANGIYDAIDNTKIHTMKTGLKIQLNLNKTGQIVSAFPLY